VDDDAIADQSVEDRAPAPMAQSRPTQTPGPITAPAAIRVPLRSRHAGRPPRAGLSYARFKQRARMHLRGGCAPAHAEQRRRQQCRREQRPRDGNKATIRLRRDQHGDIARRRGFEARRDETCPGRVAAKSPRYFELSRKLSPTLPPYRAGQYCRCADRAGRRHAVWRVPARRSRRSSTRSSV